MKADRRPAKPRQWRGDLEMALVGGIIGVISLLIAYLWPVMGVILLPCAILAGAVAVEAAWPYRRSEQHLLRRQALIAGSLGAFVFVVAAAEVLAVIVPLGDSASLKL